MMSEAVFLVVLGFGVGIVAGLLGVGGGILMVPALVFLPPLWGAQGIDIRMATGISAAQCLVGGLSSWLGHHRKGSVVASLVMPLVLGSLSGGFLGGYASAFFSTLLLYILFALILVVTLLISIFMPTRDAEQQPDQMESLSFPAWQGFGLGCSISFLAANTGIGGAILLLPVLIYLKKVPVRLAIGAGASLVVVTSFSAVLGKWMVHLIPWAQVLWISIGAILGGYLGAHLSHKLPTVFLRRLMLVLVIMSLVRVLFEIAHLLG